MKLSGLICALPKWMGGGHKRGVLRDIEDRDDNTRVRYFNCPRCGRETRYKVKPPLDGNTGSPADGSMSFREVKDGGPAFPVMTEWGQYLEGTYTAPGMSLRDYFAAAALQSGCAISGERGKDDFKSAEGIAAYYYRIADAMLAEREKE